MASLASAIDVDAEEAAQVSPDESPRIVSGTGKADAPLELASSDSEDDRRRRRRPRRAPSSPYAAPDVQPHGQARGWLRGTRCATALKCSEDRTFSADAFAIVIGDQKGGAQRGQQDNG